MIKQIVIATLITIGVSEAAFAACSGVAPTDKMFGIGINDTTVDQCASFSTSTFEQAFNSFKDAQVQTLIPGYQEGDNAIFDLWWFGLSTSMSATGTLVSLSIPAIGINQSFNGATRDASMDLLKDYVKDNDILSKIMNYQALHSANSPLTGTSGLVPLTISGDFNQNFTDSATNIAAASSSAQGATGNLTGVGMQYTMLTQQGIDNKTVTLPLSYTIRNDIDPRRQLVISLPITQVDTDGAKTYMGGLGAAYRLPMNDNWTLTPSLKYSIVGSVDLATVATLWAGSLTSTYIFRRDSFDIAIGNMVGYYKTGKFSAGDFNSNPDLTFVPMRNGVMLSQPVTLGGKKLSLEYSLIDTRYLGGDKPYVDNLQEMGITIGTNKNAFNAKSFVRAGATYIHAQDTNGYRLNLGYWF